jgi:outer membrane biosynthesis protein TonB
MARAGRTEPDSVSIWLKLSAEDAARMTQVLTRPEFAGWTRAEWCLEMIQTALGYYTRPRPAESAPVKEPEPAEPEPAEPEPARSAAPEPVPDAPKPVPDAPKPVADEPEPPVQADCPHPADARDYQSGTCAACGAILWD